MRLRNFQLGLDSMPVTMVVPEDMLCLSDQLNECIRAHVKMVKSLKGKKA